MTWAYRVGVNYLLNLRRGSSAEATSLSFDEFRDGLAEGLADADYRGPEAQVLADEMRLSCTQAMLQCLERHERIAFVLGEIFELTSADAAWILDTTPAAFRKRLERARTRIRGFMESTCGLVNPNAFCRCARRVPTGDRIGSHRPRPARIRHSPRERIGSGRRPGRSATRHAAQRRCRTEGAPRLRRAPSEGRRDRRRCCSPGDSRCWNDPVPTPSSGGFGSNAMSRA